MSGCTATCIAGTITALHHADGRSTRVVSQARGLHAKGETAGYDASKLIAV